jgi:hypothetical protein
MLTQHKPNAGSGQRRESISERLRRPQVGGHDVTPLLQQKASQRLAFARQSNNNSAPVSQIKTR